MPDHSDLGFEPAKSYNTSLAPNEETQFKSWKQKNAPNDSGEDYDLRGAFKANISRDERGHGPDTFKKPNHPTFSGESQYSTPENPGGKWYDQGGKTHFAPSAANLKDRSFSDLQDYFKKYEPDAILDQPSGSPHADLGFVATTPKRVPGPGERFVSAAVQPFEAAASLLDPRGERQFRPATLPNIAEDVLSIPKDVLAKAKAGDYAGALGEVAGNVGLGAALGKVGSVGRGAEAAATRSAIMERMGVPEETAAASTGGGAVSTVRGLYNLYKAAQRFSPKKLGEAGFEKFLDHLEGKTPEPAPPAVPAPPPEATAPPVAVDPILEHIARAKANVAAQDAITPKTPRDAAYYGVAPKAATATPAAAAPVGPDYVMPGPAQIPAGASPAQMAPFTPQTVLDYLQGQARPALETPAEVAGAPMKEVAQRPTRGKVVTIPAPEPEFSPDVYAASARATKAGKLASVLHEHGIPYEDAKLMGEPEWAQAAQAAGVKVPSADSVKLALFELKKLGGKAKLAKMSEKAAKAAQDLGTLE